MYSSFLEIPRQKKEENDFNVNLDHQNDLFARAIITSTSRASSVFLSSERNTILNQWPRVFC